MKTTLFAIAAAGLIAIPSLAAAAASDVDYLRASRCKGLAETVGAGSVDAAKLNAFLKTEGSRRDPYIQQRGDDEAARARREARNGEARGRLSAELAGPCAAFISPAKDMAGKEGHPAL